MFGEVWLAAAEYDAYVIARLETEFGAEPPDPADFVTDEHQRFLDARARMLSAGAAHLEVAAGAERDAARVEASRAQTLVLFARSRPASMFDHVPGERGAASAASVAARPAALTEVSEWAVDEVAATLRVSGRTASLMLTDAVTLVEGLPATYALLRAGDISPAHARAMIQIAGAVSTPEKRAEVEAAVLPRAPQQTAPALRACLRRAVTRIDAAAAAARLAQAVRRRQVRLDGQDDGMSALTAVFTTPVGRACYEALSAYARACAVDEDGNRDPRTHQQRMADCLADLILRPDGDHPAIRLVLTLVARVGTLTGQGPDADEPGEIDGDVVPAPLVRELAYTLGLLPRPAETEPTTTGTDPTGTIDHPADPDTADAQERATGQEHATAQERAAVGDGGPEMDIAALRAEELAAAEEVATAYAQAHSNVATSDSTVQHSTASVRAALTRLLDTRWLIDTALAERPRIAVTDQLTGALLALTDSTELRAVATSGRGLGPPPGTLAYRPTDPLHRFVALRDRRCRFPGCRVRARCCDLDHSVPFPHGPTTHGNLACLCEHHHRLSHQAPGWRLHRDPDGGLVWTLPSGRVITTRPPAFGTDDGSTPTVSPSPRTGREQYADLLKTIRAAGPGQAHADIPF